MLDENPFHLSKGRKEQLPSTSKMWIKRRMKRAVGGGKGGGEEGVGGKGWGGGGGGVGGGEGDGEGGGEDVDDEKKLFPRSSGSYRDAPQSVSVVAKLK